VITYDVIANFNFDVNTIEIAINVGINIDFNINSTVIVPIVDTCIITIVNGFVPSGIIMVIGNIMRHPYQACIAVSSTVDPCLVWETRHKMFILWSIFLHALSQGSIIAQKPVSPTA
jgi:hypothetical protein